MASGIAAAAYRERIRANEAARRILRRQCQAACPHADAGAPTTTGTATGTCCRYEESMDEQRLYCGYGYPDGDLMAEEERVEVRVCRVLLVE